MHNFFSLVFGEKWAKDGTKFRPRDYRGYPSPEIYKDSIQVSSRIVAVLCRDYPHLYGISG